jgi:hypothetical protein
MRRVLPTAEFVNAKGAVSSADFPHVVTESIYNKFFFYSLNQHLESH